MRYAIAGEDGIETHLFPEKMGEVFFEKVVEIPNNLTSEALINHIDTYIGEYARINGADVKRLSKNGNKLNYSFEIKLDEQPTGMEIWETPLLTNDRDVSRISFHLVAEISGKNVRYRLFNFETKRAPIPGDTPKAGQPNEMHWKRVNAIASQRDRFAHTNNMDKSDNQRRVYDYNLQILSETAQYISEYNLVQLLFNGLDNIKVDELGFGEDYNPHTNGLKHPYITYSLLNRYDITPSMVAKAEQVLESDSDEKTSFRLERGNKVFVTSGARRHEQMGAKELVRYLAGDGFWTIVDSKEDADFMITYRVNLSGRDKAFLVISTPNGKYHVTDFWGSEASAGEDYDDIVDATEELYEDGIENLQNKIMKGDKKLYTKFNAFFR